MTYLNLQMSYDFRFFASYPYLIDNIESFFHLSPIFANITK